MFVHIHVIYGEMHIFSRASVIHAVNAEMRNAEFENWLIGFIVK